MAKQMNRATRASQRKQAAAINILAAGLLILLLPLFLGKPVFAAAIKPLSPLRWLLLVVGGALLLILRRKPTQPAPAAPDKEAAVSPRSPRRPMRPAPHVERLDPVAGPAFEPAASPAAPDRTVAPERVRPDTWGPAVFAAIEWRRFEAVVETLFAQAGFRTRVQSHGPDDGIDVWLYSKSQPDGTPVSVVQCEHWIAKAVGVDKVHELRGVMAAKGVTRGQFATTATFTHDAATFAGANGIKLHDGAGLLELIATRTPEQQAALLDVALEGEYWKPTCASCGTKMIVREPTAGGKPFWGCVNFSKCRTTMVMRSV